MPKACANCFATSVLPTPVGPENRKQPIGLSGWPKPERAIFTADTSTSIAASCPKIWRFSVSDRVFSACLSSCDTVVSGMRATLAIMRSISPLSMCAKRCAGCFIRCAAPASSIISIALSGRKRSLMYFADNSAAA